MPDQAEPGPLTLEGLFDEQRPSDQGAATSSTTLPMPLRPDSAR